MFVTRLENKLSYFSAFNFILFGINIVIFFSEIVLLYIYYDHFIFILN